jgi:hypothetical protein
MHADYAYPVDAMQTFSWLGLPGHLTFVVAPTWVGGESWGLPAGLGTYGIGEEPIVRVPANGEFVLERIGWTPGYDTGFPLGWLGWGQFGHGLVARRARDEWYSNFPQSGTGAGGVAQYNYGTPAVPSLTSPATFRSDVFIVTDNIVFALLFGNVSLGAVCRVQGTLQLRTDFADERKAAYDPRPWKIPGYRA